MPISGVPGQQATPNPIRAMPATRATGMAMPVKFLTQQQSPDERRNDQQRQSRPGFPDSGENQRTFHGMGSTYFAHEAPRLPTIRSIYQIGMEQTLA